jgi:hypothetical protein
MLELLSNQGSQVFCAMRKPERQLPDIGIFADGGDKTKAIVVPVPASSRYPLPTSR